MSGRQFERAIMVVRGLPQVADFTCLDNRDQQDTSVFPTTKVNNPHNGRKAIQPCEGVRQARIDSMRVLLNPEPCLPRLLLHGQLRGLTVLESALRQDHACKHAASSGPIARAPLLPETH